MRRFPLLVMAVGLGVACGGGGGGNGGDGAAAEDGNVPALEVEGRDYSFEPSDLTATAGEAKIELKNTGAVEHDLTIDDPKLKVTALAGQTKSGTVTLEPGSYEFYCAVAGHRAQGMEGKLTVQ
ncbi:MAG: cupredoxin domain-containing protein [Acidimicrobiia bacterium]